MVKRSSPYPLIIALVVVGILTVFIDWSGLLKTQVLQTPEALSSVKLIRQKTDPIQFDIYYDQLLTDSPSDVSLVIVNSLIENNGRYSNAHLVVDKVLLQTGTQEVISTPSSQTITIRGIGKQPSTKLGTLVTFLKKSEYISLEYDTVVNRTRTTLIDNPVPADFPLDYHTVVNPTGELVYMATPGFHTILSSDEKAVIKAQEIRHGALLLPNTITTLQELEGLSASNLIGQSINRQTPPLTIEQNQIVLPEIPGNDLNTLIIRYRNGANAWDYNYFLLSATKDITLKVPLQHMLHFYSDVEYGFAYISNGLSTLNLDFPYNSLLTNQYPVYYRTDFASLVPELYKTSNSLNMNLTVSIASEPDSIAIGLLTREPLSNISQVLQKIEQKLPIMIFADDSENFSTWVSQPNELPYFNLVGKNDQVWSQKITTNNISLVSQQFQQIPLLSTEQIPELEVVNESLGDRLVCLLKTDSGSYSLGTIRTDLMFTSSCLLSARRAGFTSGTIYPLRFEAVSQQFLALKHFDFDENLSSQLPLIKNYDPTKKIVSLNNTFNREKIQLLVSATPGFEASAAQNVTLTNNSFSLPLLAACESSCYFKVVSIIREDEKNVLGYASETLLFAETTLPVLQLCFSNQAQLSEVLDPEDLSVQALRSQGSSIIMKFESGSGCYEFISEESGETTDNPAGEGEQITSLQEFMSNSELLPKNTIIFHINGIANNHLIVPVQRHYLPIRIDSLQQVLITELLFEHLHLKGSKQDHLDPLLQTSYQVSLLGNEEVLMPVNRGNLILHSSGTATAFLETIPVASPLNETLLYPGGQHTLAIPNTIRFLPSDEMVIQGFQEAKQNIVLPLPVPERSQIKMFLENVFRPNIEVKQLISDGIIYHQETGFISLENPTGIISLPVQININKPTDVAQYGRTFPTTPIPDDIDIASFPSELVFEVIQAPSIPNTSILNPIDLDRAQLGFEYFSKISFGGIEATDSFEVGEGRFLTQECQDIFIFEPVERTISGNPSLENALEACYFQISVRYLTKLPYAQIEVTTLRTYRIPMLENPNDPDIVPEVIEVPIQKDTDNVDQIVNMLEPIEEVIETTAEFIPKNTQSQLISSIGELSIVFNPVSQQFIFSGNPEALNDVTKRYIQAIRTDNGALVLMEFQLIPVQRQELALPIVQSFPNAINVPQILEELKFTDEEIATLSLITDTLNTTVEVDENFVVTIFGLPEINEQVFSALLEKKLTTPSPLVEFDERLAGDDGTDSLPEKVRVDFRLTVSEPETVRLEAATFDTDKFVTIDLRSYIPDRHVLNSTQIPAFMTPNGYLLSGRTPAEAQDIELLIQDFTDVKQYLLPLTIVAPEVIEVPPITEVPAVPVDDLKGAADGCFPDIGDQPAEYRDAICLAKQHGIISGSGGLFLPNDPINRAEISKVLVTGPLVLFNLLTAADLPTLNRAFSPPRFPDVPASAWFYGFVETVKEVDIFAGYPDGSFKPANYLLRAEAAKVIVSTLLQLQPNAFPSNVIQANTISGDQWFSPYVRILNQQGGDFPEPEDIEELSRPISRAQFVYNLLILLDSKADGLASQLN